jgi:hypothetical protein
MRALVDQANADRDTFGAGSSNPNLPTLEDRVRNANSDLTLAQSGIPWLPPEESDPALLGTRQGADLYLARVLKTSDVAVVGRIAQETSVFNSSKKGMVTDSLLLVDEVIHAKRGLNLQPGSELFITRPGGTMQVDGHQIKIVDDGFPQLVVGSRYLLFLVLRPTTGSYSARAMDAFLIDGDDDRAQRNKGVHPAAAYMSNTQVFVAAVRRRAAEADR